MIVDNIKNAFEFFFNRENSLGKKTVVFLCVVAVIIILEFVFKLTYNIHVSNKLEQLNNITEIINNKPNDTEIIKYVEEQKQELINRKHYTFYLNNYYDSLSESINHIATPTNDEINIVETKKAKLSIFYTVLSGSFILLLGFAFFVLAPIWSNNYTSQNIFEAIAGGILISIVIAILTFIFMLVPVIYSPIVNYILYFVLHIIGLVLIGKKV